MLKTARAVLDFVTVRPEGWRLLRMTPPADPKIAAAYGRLRVGTRSRTAETTASDPNFPPAPGIDRMAAAGLFGDLQWTAYEALGDWALEHREMRHADLVQVFMDFMWIGLQRNHRGKHWRLDKPRRDGGGAETAHG